MTLSTFPRLRVFWNGSLGIPRWTGDDHRTQNVSMRLRPTRALQDYETTRVLADKLEVARRRVNESPWLRLKTHMKPNED